MSNLSVALTIVISINLMLVLGQAAVFGINPEATQFYNAEGSIIDQFNEGNNTHPILRGDDPGGIFPDDSNQVEGGTGNLFTDTWAKLKANFLEIPLLRFVFNVLGAPGRMLVLLQLPTVFTYTVGALWYGITLFLLLAFIFGRDA